MNNAVVCIAGAHRSGTSMLTRLLQRCGLYLGPESDLMPAAADNPDGFWENLRFVKLNDELLNAVGAAWDLPPREEQAFAGAELQPMRIKARLLMEEFAAHRVWGWKDPRNSLTLPFWQSLLPELKTVIIIRNPLEVAYSMNKRNGTSYALGLRLWEIYNRRLLAKTDPEKRVLTSYAAFFEGPQKELRKIADFAGLETNDAFHEAVALVAVNRRHTAFTTEQMIDAGVAEPIIALYANLLEGAKGHQLSGVGEKRDARQGDQLSGADSQLRTSIPDNEEIRQELAARRGAEIRHQEEIARHQKTIETLRQELVAKSVKAAADLNRRDGRIEELQNAYAHLDKLLHGEQEQRTKLFAELERVRRETWDQVEAARRQINAVSQELEGYRQREDAARTQLERDEQNLRALQQLLENSQQETESARNQALQEREEAKAARQELDHSEKNLYAAREQLKTNKALLDTLDQEKKRDREEIRQLRERFVQTNEVLQKTSVRLTDFESRTGSLTERLRKQLLEMQRLLRFLDQIVDASERLRRSRRWKFANPIAAVLAPMTGNTLPGYGHLDKNVEKYQSWKAKHPETASFAEEIQALRPREILPPAETQVAPMRQNQPAAPPQPAPPKTPVSFVDQETVEISIVIPVYNQVDYTHACLAAVEKHSSGLSYEVIIVDDASTDTTREVIGTIPGLVYLRAEANAGFIASCNRGASAARGSYLVFLNNDTTVTANWLSALRETFAFAPAAGLVGSKLVYPDGRLQEAGGIIWRDGSGWNRGKFQDPSKPEYNYLREVDYCSAASLMIPTSLFQQLGGFDHNYAPAYYEDTDLAFKVAKAGRTVFYQPLSVVIHYEGVTGGTDISAGTKRYQEINRTTFCSTWAAVLAGKPENGNVFAYEALPRGKKRILVIDHHLPMPDRDSGSLRMFQILTILQGLGHRVTFLPDNLADIPPYGDDLRKRGIEVVHHPYTKKITEYLQTYGPTFDAVILSRCDFARKHIDEVRRFAPQSRVIFDTVDLHFLRTDREAQLTDDPATKAVALEKEQLEYALIDKSDETWVVSTVERALLLQQRPKKSIQIVSNIVDIPGSATPFSLRKDFLFIGSFQHPPNTDGVLFFARDILPLVQQELGPVKFYVIGDKAPPEVVALANETTIVTGLQRDVRPYFDNVKLSVAPLRYGAGVKGKINQSMGFGVPVVATSIAAEGMELTDREDALVADTNQDFARALIELYTSQSLWEHVSQAGLEKTQALYSRAAAEKKLRQLFSNDQPKNQPTDRSESTGAATLQPLASV
ncbi:MAG: glycosyltransferase [Chthoniobacterales bacterium]